MALFADAYANRRILLADGYSLVAYAAILPPPEGVTQEEWCYVPLSDQLVQSGAFSRVDMLEISFTTAETAIKQLSGTRTFSLGAQAEATVESAQATFSQATYELTLRNAGAEEWYFAVLSPDCQTGPSYTHWETGADGAQHASGAVSLFGEASTLTFVPCRDSQSVAEVYARQQPLTDEQKALSFTVELE